MSHSDALNELVEDIKTGKSIAVSDISGDPETQFNIVAWSLKSETGY